MKSRHIVIILVILAAVTGVMMAALTVISGFSGKNKSESSVTEAEEAAPEGYLSLKEMGEMDHASNDGVDGGVSGNNNDQIIDEPSTAEDETESDALESVESTESTESKASTKSVGSTEINEEGSEGTESAATDGLIKKKGEPDAVNEILDKMTLEEKVFQMFIVTPEMLTGAQNVTEAGAVTEESLVKCPVGGLIYMSPNLLDREQTIKMLKRTQEYSYETEELPLFLCIDEEGGKVQRIAGKDSFGIKSIKPMKNVESADEAYEIGAEIGAYLSELGFNVDFAPDADVLTNQDNSVIGSRSFGDDPSRVTEYASAYSRGLKSKGVLSTFKHFPGHGATTDDTHKGFAYTDKNLEELRKRELVPFASAQAEGVDFVMVSHISVPGILGDNTPCTMSKQMITGVLREELGYEGMIITDAMNMAAITGNYDGVQAVVEAVKAGADLVLMPGDMRASADAIVKAVNSGDIDISAIDDSVKKIIRKKLELYPER